LEDARVEHALFGYKPGTKKHLEALRGKLFDGDRAEIEALIGTPWNERGDDDQVTIGCYLLGSGYRVEGRLADGPVAALRSIEPLILTTVGSDNVADLYGHAVEVLEALQRLGYLRTGDERDAPVGPTDHPETDEDFMGAAGSPFDGPCCHPRDAIVECASPRCSGNCTVCGAHIITAESDSEGEGESSGSSSPTSTRSAKPGRSKKGSESEGDEGDTAKSGARGGSTTKDEDAEAKAEAMTGEAEKPSMTDAELHEALHRIGGHDHETESEHSFKPDVATEAISLYEYGYEDGDTLTAGVTQIDSKVSAEAATDFWTAGRRATTYDIDGTVTKVLPDLRTALVVNGRTGFTPDLRAGRVNARALYRTATGYTRVFGRYTTPESRDYNVVMALDCSGSMGGGYTSQSKLMKAAAIAVADMLSMINVPFAAFGYTGDHSGDRGGWRLDIQRAKDFAEPWDARARRRLSGLETGYANLDGTTMGFARVMGRAGARTPNTRTIVLYFNDGGMPAENSRNEAAAIKAELLNAERNKTHFVGVGVGSDAAARAGLDFVPLFGLDDLTKVCVRIGQLIGGTA
jgi:hypothetical protein